MKKGFTMIELIFVIVILGILAATAIPKLNATRDDARMVTAAQEADRIFSELGGYYTAQGRFDANFRTQGSQNVSGMTNVTNPIMLGNNECLKVSAMDQNKTPGGVQVNVDIAGLCSNLWSTAAMQQLSKSFFEDENFSRPFPSSTSKQSGGQYKYNAAKETVYTTFGTTTGINFGN